MEEETKKIGYRIYCKDGTAFDVKNEQLNTCAMLANVYLTMDNPKRYICTEQIARIDEIDISGSSECNHTWMKYAGSLYRCPYCHKMLEIRDKPLQTV